MKKLILLTLIILGTTACTTNDIYETYVNSYTNNFTVKLNDWKVASDNFGTYFYCDKRIPELTYDVFDNGIMNGYLYYVQDGVETISPLPFDDFFNEEVDQWTEQVTCEFKPGYVTFILKYDDQTTNPPTYDYEFMVKMMW